MRRSDWSGARWMWGDLLGGYYNNPDKRSCSELGSGEKLMEWMASKAIWDIKVSRLIEFWRREIEESVKGDRGKIEESGRFRPWLLDSWGLHSLRFGTQRTSRIWGTEDEFKCLCLWRDQVEMANRKLAAWVWMLIRSGLWHRLGYERHYKNEAGSLRP